MSKLKKGDNPAPYVANIVSDEKGRVTIPPEKYTITVAPLDVRNNVMKLTNVEEFSYKEINGKIYRIGKNGIQYPPISKKQFETIKKLHKEAFDHQKDDEPEI